MEDTNSYNKFSERFTRRKSEELAAMIGDHNFEEEARIAAALELEKRGEGTPEEILEKAKLTNGLRATEQRANDKYRTFSARFVAAIIDSLVLIPISVVLIFSMDTYGYLYTLLDGVSVYAYYILMHGYRGQTLGKMVMEIKVVNHRDESDITYKQALMRDIVPLGLTLAIHLMNWSLVSMDMANYTFEWLMVMTFVGSLPLIWTIIEILSMLTNKKSRAIHDFIARTVVVKTKYGN